MTRAQILSLITQYIFTNGKQLITAAQLHDILSEMAESFAMNGEVELGIEEVLQKGNTVSDGQEITNDSGGILKFSATETLDTYVFNYMGFENSLPGSQAAAMVGQSQSALGSVKRSDPSRNFFDMSQGTLLKGENLMAITCISEASNLIQPAILLRAVDDRTSATAMFNTNKISNYVNGENSSEDLSTTTQSTTEIQHLIKAGPQTSSHIQTNLDMEQKVSDQLSTFYSNMNMFVQTWGNQVGEIASIGSEGLSLKSGKKVDIHLSGGNSTGVTLSSDATGGVLASFGPTSTMKVSAHQTTLESSSINFKATGAGAVYATLSASGFAIGPAMTPAKVSIYQTGVSTIGLSCENNASGNNVAINANAFNGEINTALLAANGNIVALNGSAMFGFGSGLSVPSARMDIKSQGTAPTDLALRIRNSDNTKSILEVRGNNETALLGSLVGTSDFEFNVIRGFALSGCQMGTDMNYNGQDQYNASRIHLRGNSSDTNGTNVINVGNGTAPTTNNENAFRMYAADQSAGNSAPHFRTENGSVVKIYQETNRVGEAVFVPSGTGKEIKETDKFDGYTLKQIVKALRNLGILE